ncbi:cytochrome P450 [Deinococcus metalli]|uniref:Cytochrome P450 n=1 Tax=Deinococcus metalli TaxID=1141878 RepID=A0A7W8KD25_9DEIO|nr:cytochrome P450 [Deinococcus metalli]MBB5375972.1 cytochrome P450 [Deinococcus metalli]GHF41768.1 cytochrome P450 [Deinococcus metalli]
MTLPETMTDVQAAVQALWHPDAVPDPYPGYERVRALSTQGVLEGAFPEWPGVFLSGHASCSAVLRSAHALSGSGMPGPDAPASDGVQLLRSMMLFHNGLSHQRLRGLVSAAFTPRVVEEQRELVRSLLDDLLTKLAARGGGDIVADVSNPLPARVIMGMLGLGGEDEARFVRWSQSVADLLAGSENSPELMARIDADAREMRAFFAGLADDLRARPQPGLLSALAAAQDGGEKLSGDELLSNAVLLLTAGHETTSNLIPGGLLELSRQPEAWAALVEQPRHGGVADELLRVVSPVQFDGRGLGGPVTVGDVTLAAGSFAQLMLGAANRDPEVFPDPGRIDWERPNAGRHLAFAAGPHYCLGASLARLEISETFAALATRFPDLTVTDTDPPFKPNPVLRGVQRLNVTLA